MKIAFLGYDYTLDIAQRLIMQGHEVIHIFTFPCDNIFAFNAQTKELAANFNIPISDHKITDQDINDLINNGCEIFICAGYPYKIPEIDRNLCYGINLHPTLLPRARGIMPLPYVIMQDRKAAGFTIHKLESEFDSGDILYQKKINIDESTDIETLSAKISIHCPDAILDIVENIKEYWDNAIAQDNENASHYNAPSKEIRSITWDSTPKEISLKGKAFGRFGVIAEIENDIGQQQKLAVFNLSAWQEKHQHKSGYILRSSSREIIIAINDGYACLKEFQLIE